MSQPWKGVIVGGGFGGLSSTRHLKSELVQVTLVDRRNYHLFQPHLYQVATGSLSPGEIAAPLRSVLSAQKNMRVLLGTIVDVDPESKRVLLKDGGRYSLPSRSARPCRRQVQEAQRRAGADPRKRPGRVGLDRDAGSHRRRLVPGGPVRDCLGSGYAASARRIGAGRHGPTVVVGISISGAEHRHGQVR